MEERNEEQMTQEISAAQETPTEQGTPTEQEKSEAKLLLERKFAEKLGFAQGFAIGYLEVRYPDELTDFWKEGIKKVNSVSSLREIVGAACMRESFAVIQKLISWYVR